MPDRLVPVVYAGGAGLPEPGTGQGSHARAMRAIERLRAHGVEFNILTMVTPVSAARPDDVWDFMMAHDLRFLQFIPCAERDPHSGEPARLPEPRTGSPARAADRHGPRPGGLGQGPGNLVPSL